MADLCFAFVALALIEAKMRDVGRGLEFPPFGGIG